MPAKRLGLIIFFLGVILLQIYSTIPFLWQVVGITLEYPLEATNEGVLALLPAFAPSTSAILMVVGGVIYGNKSKEVI